MLGMPIHVFLRVGLFNIDLGCVLLESSCIDSTYSKPEVSGRPLG